VWCISSRRKSPTVGDSAQVNREDLRATTHILFLWRRYLYLAAVHPRNEDGTHGRRPQPVENCWPPPEGGGRVDQARSKNLMTSEYVGSSILVVRPSVPLMAALRISTPENPSCSVA